MKKLLTFIVFAIMIQPVSAVHFGYIDREDQDPNNAQRTIKIRQIVVDFDNAAPGDLTKLETFKKEHLIDKIKSKIDLSGYQQYKKRNLEIMFRNINNMHHVKTICTM